MGYISDQIAEYMRAADAEDTAARRRSLEIMKTHPLTLPDWRAVKECLEKHELYGDLEEVTRSFIEAGGPATIEPYLTLASLRRSDQGYGIILKYLDEFGDLPANRPHVITSLYKMMQYGACLEFTVSALRSDPTNVIFRAFEARCLWRLGRRRYAHRKHMAIKKLLGRDAGKWIWFLTVAFEFGDARLVRKSAEELTLLLSDNRTTVPRNIITLFTDVGVPEFAQRLIRSARPEDYHDPSDLQFLFDSALRFGLYECAFRFGERIIQLKPDERIQAKFQEIAAQRHMVARLNNSPRQSSKKFGTLPSLVAAMLRNIGRYARRSR